MVSLVNLFALGACAAMGVLLPIGLILWVLIRHRRRRRALLLGCASFVLLALVTFLLTEVALVTPLMSVYFSLGASMPFVLLLLLALASAVLEEGGKYLGLRFGLRRGGWLDGAAFAVGFCALYELVFVGLSQLCDLLAAIEIYLHGAQSLVSSLGDLSQANVYLEELGNAHVYDIVLLCVHSLLVLAIEFSLCLLIFGGFRRGRKAGVAYLLLATAIHVALEAGSFFLQDNRMLEAYFLLFAILCACAVLHTVKKERLQKTHRRQLKKPMDCGKPSTARVKEASYRRHG